MHRQILEEIDEEMPLVACRNAVEPLLDPLDGHDLGRHLDPDRILQELARQLRDLGRHGGREQERLPILRQQRHDLHHVTDETHVEHAVRLVEDEMGHLVEAHDARLQVIEQTARRGDENVDALFERADLRLMADAAKDERVTNAEELRVFAQFSIDLDGQFARRRKNESTNTLRLEAVGTTRKMLEKWQAEGRRLARSGLRYAEHVATFEKGGDCLRLDWRRLNQAGHVKRTQERFGKGQIREIVQLIQEVSLNMRVLLALV
ncbi:cellobiose-specific phosphotransferase system component IIA [Kaistia dalseonensis]|uniref:Cellobiose-specific phosphotransferase system component IIA n=1 Tax=Kaistia dalseonensis TaxID=410840 RepID=A0ABU0H6F4_9HYPH|nr:cellobiose-specific phosphotransferase system component IIA [Kaistia dalseonensis]